MPDKPWFRWYRGTAADPKMRAVVRYANEENVEVSLADVIAVWAVVLELTGNGGVTEAFGRGDDPLDNLSLCVYDYCAVKHCYHILEAMIEIGMIAPKGKHFVVKNWEKRQTFDTTAAERQARFRERKRNAKSNAETTPVLRDTESYTDTDTDTESYKKKSKTLVRLNARTSDYSDSFEAFWELYPRRVGKRQAFLAWQKAIKRAAAAEVSAGAERLAQEVADGREIQFVKHPQTWLNADGWLDEPWSPKQRMSEIERAMLQNLKRNS